MKSVLITGASTGIGKSCAKTLSENNYRVFGTVRNEEDANTLKQEFGKYFTPIIMDVRNKKKIFFTLDQ